MHLQIGVGRAEGSQRARWQVNGTDGIADREQPSLLGAHPRWQANEQRQSALRVGQAAEPWDGPKESHRVGIGARRQRGEQDRRDSDSHELVKEP